MSNKRQLIEALGVMPTYLIQGTVEDVDKSANTCTVRPVSSRLSEPFTGVRLLVLPDLDKGLVLYPAVGSSVLMAQVSEFVAAVVQYSEIEQADISINTTLNIQTGDGTPEPAVLGDTLNQNLSDLISALNDLTKALNRFSVAQATAIAAAPPLAPLAGGYTALTTDLQALLAQIPTVSEAIKRHLSTSFTHT